MLRNFLGSFLLVDFLVNFVLAIDIMPDFYFDISNRANLELNPFFCAFVVATSGDSRCNHTFYELLDYPRYLDRAIRCS